MADTLFPQPSPEPRADRRHARRRRGGRTALVVLASLLAVLVLGGVGGAWWFQRQLDSNIEKLADPFEGLENRPDPAPTNLRAIRCYEKAGFRRLRTIVTPDGPAEYMVRDRW